MARPTNVLFDEPVNGLDPDGVAWVRQLARQLAEEGAAVLMSSHLLGELAQTADRVVVIGRGSILAETSMSDLVRATSVATGVASADDARLGRALTAEGLEWQPAPGGLTVSAEPGRVGQCALEARVALVSLQQRQLTLEDRFRELTSDQVDRRHRHRGPAAGSDRRPSR
ncbi:MAG: hypothetical protein ACK5LS_06020 [Propioniciclava sp.]